MPIQLFSILVFLPILLGVQISSKIRNILLEYYHSPILVAGLCYKLVLFSAVLFYISSNYIPAYWNIIFYFLGFTIAVFAIGILINYYKKYKNLEKMQFCVIVCTVVGMFNLIGLIEMVK